MALPNDISQVPTSVTNSCVAYLTVALQGLEDGGTEFGLAPDAARRFVTQTLLTTARLLQEHPGSPADLKDQVASPGGTTITGLAVLEQKAVRGALLEAMRDAVAAAPAQ